MRVFGNINNRITEQLSLVPEVGMGVTLNYYSDQHAGTIIEVTPNKIVVQEDTSTLIGGSLLSEYQEYSFAPNPKGKIHDFSLRSNGLWIECGSSANNGTSLTIGQRDEYCDPSF
jgi:hypothetical protein